MLDRVRSGSTVISEALSVMPYPLNTVACGNASFTDRTNDGAIGAPP